MVCDGQGWSAPHRGSSCSVHLFLLVACNMVGWTLVSDGRGGQSRPQRQNSAHQKKKKVRHLHPHPHSIMLTNPSESFFNCVLCTFLGLPVSSDFQGRSNFGMASVLLAGTSARTLPAMFALIVGEAFASYGIRDPNHPCVAEPHMEVSWCSRRVFLPCCLHHGRSRSR